MLFRSGGRLVKEKYLRFQSQCSCDRYTLLLTPSDFHIFTLNDSTVGVESDLLSEALRNLTDKKREIILLYYFMDMNDTEIADLLKLNRSTVYRHRTSGLAFIKEFMEENEE